MKTNKEIRQEAWALLWQRKTFLKMTGMMLLHIAVLVGVCGTLAYAMLGMKEPEQSIAGVLVNILAGIFQGVVILGLSAMTLALVKGAPAPYRESFIGYSYPFRAFFAQLVLGFMITLWTIPFALLLVLSASLSSMAIFLLAYIGYIIAVFVVGYRYRLFWYVKAENPSSGAFEALGEAVKLVNGHKLALFKFDMSYWLAALWLFVPIVGGFIFVTYWSLGSAIFYRELKDVV